MNEKSKRSIHNGNILLDILVQHAMAMPMRVQHLPTLCPCQSAEWQSDEVVCSAIAVRLTNVPKYNYNWRAKTKKRMEKARENSWSNRECIGCIKLNTPRARE